MKKEIRDEFWDIPVCKKNNLFFLCHKSKAISEFKKIEPLLNSIFIETNPVPIKYLLSKQNLCLQNVRLPLGSLSANSKQAIDQLAP